MDDDLAAFEMSPTNLRDILLGAMRVRTFTLVGLEAILDATRLRQCAPSRVDHSAHLSTRQYARLVDEWVTAIGLRKEDYGTHSLRRTKASIIYKATGNLRAVQILLGHTKIESTVRYLGVDVEDALTLAEATEV